MADENIVFALTPARVSNDIIDYSTTSGQKLYKSAVAALKTDFDCQAANLKVFLTELRDRSMQSGWESILELPHDEDADEVYNLIDDYGQISMDELLDHAERITLSVTREAQESMQLYHCIRATLTKEAMAKIALFRAEYTIDGTASGLLLLKVVIRESHIDTNATTKFIRERLSSLDTYMKSISSDVEKFNQYVKDQLNSLAARGQATQDLLANLFKGYKAASDKKFQEYIQKKEDDYDDGMEIQPMQLMQLALNKYKTLVEGGKWNAQTEEEERIIALEAQLRQLANPKKNNRDKKNQKDSKKKGEKKGKKPKWMTVKPKDGEPNHKTVDNKKYWYCPNHEAWVRHSPSECKGINFKGNKSDKNPEEKESEKKSETVSKKKSKALKLSQALSAVAEETDEE
jgi:hypothetical protein